MNTTARTIHIFGSLNMDFVCQTDRLPLPGETILGHRFATVPGGKGANQAVAVARLGAKASMVGRVGADNFGDRLIASLQANGVDTRNISREPATAEDTPTTGMASIIVDQAGNNQIVVIPGANSQVDTADVANLASSFQAGDLLLMQFEIPLNAVMEAAVVAKQKQVTVMVDPAPAQAHLPDNFFTLVDILTPNQTEAEALVGFPVTSEDSAFKAAEILVRRGVGLVIIKLGADGAVVANGETCFHQPAFSVNVVDTVAAGDAFNGGLAIALANGRPLTAAVKFATATAALSVTQRGAQPSMPTLHQVDTLLAKLC
jgi:ribokinase